MVRCMDCVKYTRIKLGPAEPGFGVGWSGYRDRSGHGDESARTVVVRAGDSNRPRFNGQGQPLLRAASASTSFASGNIA